MITLRFMNTDAIPNVQEVQCSEASIPLIMQWYGAFYAGDRYTVTKNGVRLEKDHNGKLLTGGET